MAKFQWNTAGEPRGDHPLWLNKKRATKRIRTIQRTEEAIARAQLRSEISTAATNDQVLFHKLVRRQRLGSVPATALLIGDNLITDEAAIREEFATAAEN